MLGLNIAANVIGFQHGMAYLYYYTQGQFLSKLHDSYKCKGMPGNILYTVFPQLTPWDLLFSTGSEPLELYEARVN
jgi:hypothetical protein